MDPTDIAAPTRRTRAAMLAMALGLGSIFGVAACSDEDGDGGELDEEVDDVQEGVDDATDAVEEEVDEETDALEEGDNEG